MTLPRNRWLLPIGHLLIDCILSIVWLWHSQGIANRRKAELPLDHLVQPVLFQEAGAPGWDFSYDAPPAPEGVFLISGNLAVSAVSLTVRPPQRGALDKWDPVWYSFHETVAFPFWFLLGFAADVGFLRIGKWLRIHLWLCAVGTLVSATEIGGRMAALGGLLFWSWLTLYVLVRVCVWGWKRVKSLRRPEGREIRDFQK